MEDKTYVQLELIKGDRGTLHKLRAVVHLSNGKSIYRTLCNFRRYDWSFTEDENGEHGYGGGTNVCNGSGFQYPARSVEEFYAVTLAVCVERMWVSMARTVEDAARVKGVPFERWTEEEKALGLAANRAVHTLRDMARPALDFLLADAIASTHDNRQYFERVAAGYRGGRVAWPVMCECIGFTPEACWAEKEGQI